MQMLCSPAPPMTSPRLHAKPFSAIPSSRSARSSVFLGGGGRGSWRTSTNLVSSSSRRRRGNGGLGCRCLFGLGVPELAVIASVAVLAFGPAKLPDVGRSIAKTVKSFQQAGKEFEIELRKETEDASQPSPAQGSKSVRSEEEKKEFEAASSTKETA